MKCGFAIPEMSCSVYRKNVINGTERVDTAVLLAKGSRVIVKSEFVASKICITFHCYYMDRMSK